MSKRSPSPPPFSSVVYPLSPNIDPPAYHQLFGGTSSGWENPEAHNPQHQLFGGTSSGWENPKAHNPQHQQFGGPSQGSWENPETHNPQHQQFGGPSQGSWANPEAHNPQHQQFGGTSSGWENPETQNGQGSQAEGHRWNSSPQFPVTQQPTSVISTENGDNDADAAAQLNSGDSPTRLDCPSCHETHETRERFEPSTCTHFLGCLCFLTLLWPCCWLHYHSKTCYTNQHFCSNCGEYIASIDQKGTNTETSNNECNCAAEIFSCVAKLMNGFCLVLICCVILIFLYRKN